LNANHIQQKALTKALWHHKPQLEHQARSAESSD